MSLLATPEYIEQNRLLHAQRPDYGCYGAKWAEQVWKLAHQYGTASMLDYGCGKQTLSKWMRDEEHYLRLANRYCCKEHPWLANWQDYDPAIEGLDAPPRPADLVICTDVLEHIEPDFIDAVVDDLRRCTVKACLLVVATRPAKKMLPDGRNAHLIQQPVEWWLANLWSRFMVRDLHNSSGEFVFIGEPT